MRKSLKAPTSDPIRNGGGQAARKRRVNSLKHGIAAEAISAA